MIKLLKLFRILYQHFFPKKSVNIPEQITENELTNQFIGESLQTIFNTRIRRHHSNYENILLLEECRSGKFLFTHSYKRIQMYIYDETEPELKYLIGTLSEVDLDYKHGIWDDELFECLKQTALDKEAEWQKEWEERNRVWKEKMDEENKRKEIQEQIDQERIRKMFTKEP